MDRKRKQKIGFILLLLIFTVMVLVIFGCNMEHESRLREEQMQELVIIYPEIETQLQENFVFYQKESVQADLISMCAILGLIIMFSIGLIRVWKHEKRAHRMEIDKKTDLIYEQMKRFHKGEFEMLPSFEEFREDGAWESIYEKMRELGYYFSDLKERLAEEENSTKALITDISHQLKTPLASIRMCHELTKSTELSETERKEFLMAEAREIQKMEVLLDELVKLSRLENNMIQIKPEKSSLKQTISEAVSQVYMKAYGKEIEICVDMEKDAELPHDRKWTVEALANVLENAVKYSENGTSIHIRVTYLPGSVLIEVEDEGMGILEEDLHRIFKRFYRGSKAREKVKEGAGVGLYLARSIIEQQGGTIIAKRKTGKGTIFKIMLPLQ